MRPTPLHRLLAAGLLLATLAQCLLSMRSMSASFDEHAHLPAGYTYWRTGDFRLNPQHPPLVKLLCAAPLLLLGPRVDWSDEAWKAANEWRFGFLFFYQWGNDADHLLFWGRLPIALLSVLLGFYVWRWSSERFGPNAGATALLLYAFCPNVIAHSGFVTMDLALAAFMTVSLYYFWRFLREGTLRALALCALGLGLALASKFSALALVPVILGGLTLRGRVARAGRGRASSGAVQPSAVLSWYGAIGLVLGVASLVVWASYFFSTDPLVYFEGLALVNRDHPVDQQYYLLGEFKRGGWWTYFLVAFLLKTPVPALIAIAVGLVLVWQVRATSWRDDLVLLLPAAVFFAATSLFADNLGVRYVLPVYPLLFVLAGRAGERFTRHKLGLGVSLGLAAWYVGGTLGVYPDYLAYFNEIAGGPARGYLSLDDSNVDWGQDLLRLKARLDARGIGTILLCSNLKGYPPYYGIRAEPITPEEMVPDPLPGDYAISTHCLARVREYNPPGGPDLDWLRRFQPVERVGQTFYLFRIR